MDILFAAAALALAQAAPTAPVDHSNHSPAQHAQSHQGLQAHDQSKPECCTEVNGKMECKMMKGHGAPQGGLGTSQQGHSGH